MARPNRTLGFSLLRAGRLLLFALLFLIIAAMLIFMFGVVQGEEFCPQTFDRRQYTFYCVPFTRWQISPTFRNSTSSSLEQKLRTDNLVRTSSAKPRWDLVSVDGSLRRETAAASLLTDVFNRFPNPDWEQWTEKHSARAKILWPAVQEMAELGAYELIPDLLEFAALPADEARFPSLLRQHVASAYTSLAADYARLGQETQAQSLRDASARLAAME